MTRKKLFLTLIALAAGSVLWAQQPTWTSKLTMVKEVWLPGEPISATLSLTNDSGSAQPLAWHGQFYLDGAKDPCVDRFVVVASNPIPDTGSSGSKSPTPMILEPPGSVHQIEFAISRCCNLLAKAPQTIGRHRLCYRDQSIRGAGQEACIEFSIVSPKGADETIFNTFPSTLRDIVCDSGSLKVDLLASSPASTYAAYVVYEASGAKGLMSSDPAYVCQSIAEGSFLSSGSVPDDTGKCKDGWQSLTMEGVLKWREKWIGIILKNHPDIWFADALRLKLAIDQVALKNYQAGAAELEQLCSTAKPEVAARAKVYLDLIKQKGWVKE